MGPTTEGAAWAAGIGAVPPLGTRVAGAVPDWAGPLPPVVAVPFISFDNSTWSPAISFINLACSVMVSLWDFNSSNISLLDFDYPILQKESWNPDFRMYKHKRTQVVHLLAEGTTAGSFSCGVKLSGEYIEVETSRFLEFRKCKRCATAKPIKDVGALASALKKATT